MIKIHASYSKKIPAEIEYSSQNFSASLAIEVADETAKDSSRLQSNLNWLWRELRKSVEHQINNESQDDSPADGNEHHSYQGNGGNGNGKQSNGNGKKASNKQIQYLIGLAKQQELDFKNLNIMIQSRFAKGVYDLLISEACQLIEEMK